MRNIGDYVNAKIKVAVSVDKQCTLIRIYMENIFLPDGKQIHMVAYTYILH